MYCPFDGTKMNWVNEPHAIAECPKCKAALQYRSDPQRFDVVQEPS